MDKFPNERDKEIIILILKIILYGIIIYFSIYEKETETVSILLKITQSLREIF